MPDRRIVIEHKDGRRISVEESDFDRDDANPFNHRAVIHEFNANTGETVMTERPPKPLDDWASLKKDGFKAVAYIHGPSCTKDCTHDKDAEVYEGNEISL